ncbi:unnamed protein product [Schistocephalus solidus]|uniref:Zinc finger, C3HC4 type (RING finger) n=1 Tax=Schistocephalus solidus TaxID=70667 RepID=A0A183SQ48_SCHSO|nr:unnamed protein product [Schistocephalus solidus]
MSEMDDHFGDRAIMAIGIYSFLDNILSELSSAPPALGEGNSLSSNNDLNANELDLTNDDSGTRALSEALLETTFEETNPFLLPSTGRLSDGVSGDEEPTNYLTSRLQALEALQSDDSSSAGEESDRKDEAVAGGYQEDLFLYLSDREKEEFTCSICYAIIKDVYQCQNEHRFCYGCIYTWASGRTSGNDSCPVCRCDGLYAKNDEINERIKSKRVKCRHDSCNWLGFLREYATHMHRYYEPKELKLFSNSLMERIQSKSPSPTAPALLKASPLSDRLEACDELPSSSQLPISLSHSLVQPSEPEVSRLRNRVLVTRNVTQEAPISQTATPVNTNEPLSRLGDMSSWPQEAGEVGSHNWTAPSLPTSSPPLTAPRNLRPLRNAICPQQNLSAENEAAGAFSATRTNRLGPMESPPAIGRLSASRRTRPGLLAASRVRVSSQPSSGILRSRTNPDRTTGGGDAIRNLPFLTQTTASYCETGPRRDLRISLPPPIEVAERTTNFTPRLTSPILNLPQIDVGSVHISSPRTRLSTQRRQQVVGESPPITTTTTTLTSLRAAETRGTTSKPQLVYRRLVPVRRSEVLEQLRETREQLTTMLNLMTIELEERRRHVLSAAASAHWADRETATEGSGLHMDHRAAEPNVGEGANADAVNAGSSNQSSSAYLLAGTRHFALQHLARLHRIEVLLNEMGSARPGSNSEVRTPAVRPALQAVYPPVSGGLYQSTPRLRRRAREERSSLHRLLRRDSDTNLGVGGDSEMEPDSLTAGTDPTQTSRDGQFSTSGSIDGVAATFWGSDDELS